MEGNDFDFYKDSRPRSDQFPTYEMKQPEQPSPPPPQPEKKKGLSAGTIIILVTAGVCFLMLLGVVLLAMVDLRPDTDLEVYINKGGFHLGDTLYVDTDDIRFDIKNAGKETALSEKITLKIHGDNIADETIPWPGSDIPAGERRSTSISVTVEDPIDDFVLKISVYYDGKLQDTDRIP
ncbi:MAG: hypothetical protein JXA22_05270 [Candidatus Thermoplasmatota archaeon]|nr:hypothetical protein [Candidatus Thermoplasmatota archaeon]